MLKFTDLMKTSFGNLCGHVSWKMEKRVCSKWSNYLAIKVKLYFLILFLLKCKLIEIDRLMEWYRLEKMKSSNQSDILDPITKPCSVVPHLCFSTCPISRDMGTLPLPCTACSSTWPLYNSLHNDNPFPLAQLEAVSLCIY